MARKRKGGRPQRISLLLLAGSLVSGCLVGQALEYPAADREDVVEDHHGTRVADPYRWMERLEEPRTLEWVKAERGLTAHYLAAIPERSAIRRRLSALSSESRTEVPWREGGRIFYLHRSGLQPQSVLSMQATPDARPRIALDPNRISPDGSVAVRDYAASPDGRFLAYNTARGGSDVAEARVHVLSSGRDLEDVVGGVLNGVCWMQNGGGFFYVRRAPGGNGEGASRPRPATQVAYHALGEPPSRDRQVAEFPDARWVYCMLDEEGRHALFVAEKGTESEIRALDLGDARRPDLTRPVVALLADRRAFHTPVGIVGDTLFLRTNFRAPKECVIALDLSEGAVAAPRLVVPESADVIESAAIAGDRIVLHYLVDVKSRLRLFGLDGRPMGEIALPGPGIGSIGWPLNGRVSTGDLFYSYESFLMPPTVYRYDVRTRRSEPFRPPRIAFDARAYETAQVFFESKDGTRVPMFITAAKNLPRDGSHPVLLTAYGGYGSNLPPRYQSDVPLWLETGGVYAVANIRGGGEYGEDWHRAGMLGRKQNSFDDFIAAAEFLISQGYTTAERLAVYGHSNGGLLIAAVITQRPDLFAVAVPNAGHYDMLRYHLFTAGAAWVSEYGSPDRSEDFAWLRAYTPLQNVRAGVCYPATMLLAADHDDRVVPSHSYKFTAALQAAQACQRPILLRIAADASHEYASRQAQIEERTDMWSFIAAEVRAARHAPTAPRRPLGPRPRLSD